MFIRQMPRRQLAALIGSFRAAFWLLALGAIAPAPSVAQDTAAILTIDRIFHDKEFDLDRPVPFKWLDGGNSYTTVEKSIAVEGGGRYCSARSRHRRADRLGERC